MSDEYFFETKAIHVGQESNKWSSFEIIPPISLSTSFQQLSPNEPRKYQYSRSGNPTRECLEEALASLENAKYGLVFSSGLSAMSTIVYLLKAGDHIICSDDCYGGSARLFQIIIEHLKSKIDYVDICNVDDILLTINEKTKLILIETPTNPTFKICDIKHVVDKVRSLNRPDILICIDNTFMTPVFQQPLKFGVDIVVHSCTKYINGHSDVIMGALLLNNEKLYSKLKYLQNAIGSVSSPFDCFLVNRGIKTLYIRMKEQEKNTLKITKYLESHSKVKKLIYPGLKSHPQHELTLKQCSGFSAMFSFYLKGTKEETNKFVSSFKLITLTESLGGTKSLIEIPFSMSHSSTPPELKKKLNITYNLIRVSIGLENADDLIKDFEQAFQQLN